MANAGRGISGGLSGAAAGATVGGPIGAAIGGGVGLLGGLLSGDDVDTAALMQKAMAQFDGIVPPDLAKAIVYTQFQQGGSLTPQQLSQLPIEAQHAIQLTENPEMRQKQMAQQQALEQLAQTGFGSQERLALQQTSMKAAQDAEARKNSLLQQYAQMGQGGSLASLGAQLGSQQQSSQNEMMANMQAAAMQQENRRAAIQAAAQGATSMRGQDLSVAQANTNAQQQRQLFDIQNQMGRQQANAQYANQSNIMNLQRQQGVQDQNIQQNNQELYRRGYLAPQQMYQNQLGLASAKAGIYGQQAQAGQASNQAGAQNFANIAGGVTQAATAYNQGQQNQDYMNMQAASKGLTKDPNTGVWSSSQQPNLKTNTSSLNTYFDPKNYA